jgi:hypothetical protein
MFDDVLVFELCSIYHVGTGDKYLIATWDAINNGGAQYNGLDRSITKSSASSSTCTHNTHGTTIDGVTHSILYFRHHQVVE